MTLPDVSTNLDGQTVAQALSNWWSAASAALKEPPTLAVASAYFNANGYETLADVLDGVGSVRLLLGAEPDPGLEVRSRRPLGELPRHDLERRTALALADHQRRIIDDRDLQPFDPQTDALLARLVEWLDSGRVEVRRFERGFLHGKAYLLDSTNGGVVVGSSNLTGAGLTRNIELNLGRGDAHPVGEVRAWFDRLWEDAAPFDLAGLYRARFTPADPYVVYLRMLYERYHSQLGGEEVLPNELALARFQKNGVTRAAGFLERYGGVLIADGVGLGKTFLAGELIRRAVQVDRQRALVIAPAALRDGPWKAFRGEYQLFFELHSFDEIREDQQLGGSRPVLERPKDEYALVVIDEAHALRNPATRQSDAVRTLLAGYPPKKLVLLSATPVNNSLLDLYELIRLFIRNDAAFADAGVPSLRDHFIDANRVDPEALSPELLFDVLDAIAVRRTRRFVKRFYPRDTLRIRGQEVPLTFPKPVLRRIDYDFDAQMGSFFDEFAYALGADPDDEDNVLTPSHEHTYDPGRRLTMARYVPSAFRRDGKKDAYEVQNEGLLRSGLLKRFESSPHAFAESCRTMAAGHDLFLAALGDGYVLTGQALRTYGQSDEDLDWASADLDGRHDSATNYDVPTLREAAERDRDLLQSFAAEADRVTNDSDLKLRLLVDELARICADASREATDDRDERNRRKTLVFTYFTDTLDWIMERLEAAVETDPRLALLRGRIAAVSGRHRDETVVFGFAPDSTEAPPPAEDLYDVLVSTDVLAEGVNLQQARNIINFDLPWNPMRLVQRHGRIDRIGSPHDRVFLRTLFPSAKLDGLLTLEAKLRRKLTQAAKAIGIEGDVIAGIVSAEERTFADAVRQVRRIADEDGTLIEEMEDASTESGEEFRRELADALENGFGTAVHELAWVSGTGRVSETAGYVFCASIGDSGEPVYRFVPTVDEQPVEDGISREPLRCLSLARCSADTPIVLPTSVRENAYAAWALARQHILDEWTFRADPRNLDPKLAKPVREAGELFLRNRPDGMSDADYERICAILTARYDPRVQGALSDALKAPTIPQRLDEIVAVVDRFGLTPPDPTPTFPVIEADDIHLVTWMALVPKG